MITKTEAAKDANGASNKKEIVSFEVGTDSAGDLLSRNRIRTKAKLKVGLVATSYFEFYRMYDGLFEDINADAEVVYNRLQKGHDLIRTPLVDTLDTADARWSNAA